MFVLVVLGFGLHGGALIHLSQIGVDRDVWGLCIYWGLKTIGLSVIR